MELREAYSKMYVTDEEEKSIKRYLGFNHVAINILADLKPREYQKLLDRKWNLPSKPAEIKGLIEDFVNIYSAMCKNSVKYSGRELIRGTSSRSAENLNGEFNRIISTSSTQNIAKRFMDAKDSALIHFNLEEGVPFLNAEDYREENSESEKEIILAPFCSIQNKEAIASDSDKIRRYRIKVGAPNLQDIPPEELDKMMEEVTQGFEQNVKQMQEYEYLTGKIGRLRSQSFNASLEEKKEIDQEIDKVNNQIEENKEKTDNFRQKLQTLLKGLCKQKEKEIDLVKETITKEETRRANEEEKRREEEKIKKEEEIRKSKALEIIAKMEKNPEQAQKLSAQIMNSYEKLLRHESFYREKANMLGVSYTKTVSHTQIAKRVTTIQDTIKQVQEKVKDTTIEENTPQEVLEQISKELVPLVDGIEFGAIQAQALSEIVNLHVTQSEHELKRNLYHKVQQVVQCAKMQKCEQEKEQVLSEKIGFLGRLTGKQELQQEKLNHINLKMQLARTTQPEEKESYSVTNMLADLYACAKTEFAGGFTEEMNNLYITIKQGYNLTIPDEQIAQLADEKIMRQQNNLPIQTTNRPRFFGKTKAQTEYFKQENMALKNQIIEETQKGNMNFYRFSNEQDAIATFDSKLKSLDKITRDKSQIDRKGPTLELW